MKFSLKSYVRHVRKQNPHIQRVHAVVFAGTITALLGAAILYTQYGFWHNSYERSDEKIVQETVQAEVGSPAEIFGRLFAESKVRFKHAISSIDPLTGEGETFDRNAQNLAR